MDEDLLLKVLTGQSDAVIPVCRITWPQQRAIDAFTGAVWLSRDTVNKTEIKRHLPDLSFYTLAPLVIERGLARLIKPRHIAFLHEFETKPGKHYKAVVKCTQDGREIYLVSCHRITVAQVRTTIARSSTVE